MATSTANFSDSVVYLFCNKRKKNEFNCNFGDIIWSWKKMINCSTCYCRYHNNISWVKYCDNIMESLGDSHLYCWWSVVREWTEELCCGCYMGCGVISGLHCIPDWNGGVWAAGVETSHGGFQQVQVSVNITALCFLFFNSSFNNGRFSYLFVFLSLFLNHW